MTCASCSTLAISPRQTLAYTTELAVIIMICQNMAWQLRSTAGKLCHQLNVNPCEMLTMASQVLLLSLLCPCHDLLETFHRLPPSES